MNRDSDGIIVVSFFDGMSCGQIALERAGIKVKKYIAAEIDKHAVDVTQANYPETIQIGDVTKVKFSNGSIITENKFRYVGKVDLVIGGSPCQGFSFAGKQLNFEDPRSKLFFEFVRFYKECKETNPDVKFLLENVNMKQEYKDIISEYLGVQPIYINSNLLSAQNRKRYYWTNIKGVELPKDKGIFLKNVLHEFADEKPINITDRNIREFKKSKNGKSNCLLSSCYKGAGNNGMPLVFEWLKEYIVPFNETLQIIYKEVEKGKFGFFNKDSQANRVYYIHNKAVTLCGDAGGGAAKMGQYLIGCINPININELEKDNIINPENKIYKLKTQDQKGILIEGYIRKLTPVECERLQTVPDGYTDHVSKTQRYKMLGNGWTVDIIAHIFRNLKTY